MPQARIGPAMFPVGLPLNSAEFGQALRAMAEVVGTMQGFAELQDRHVPGIEAGTDPGDLVEVLEMRRAKITGPGALGGRYKAKELIFDNVSDQYVEKVDGFLWGGASASTGRNLPECMELNRFLNVPDGSNVYIYRTIDAQGNTHWDFHYLIEGSQGSSSDSSSGPEIAFLVRPCTPESSSDGSASGSQDESTSFPNPGNSGSVGDAIAFLVRECADAGSSGSAGSGGNQCANCVHAFGLMAGGVTGTLVRAEESYCYFGGYLGTEIPAHFWNLIWHGGNGRYQLYQGADIWRHATQQAVGTTGPPVGCPLDGTWQWVDGPGDDGEPLPNITLVAL